MLAGRPTKDNAAYDFASAGNVPVLYEGRVMPIDSLAQNSLRVISGRSYLEKDGQSIAALQWLLDLQGREDQADDYQIFRIDFPDILNLLNLDHTRTRFSFNEIVKNHEQLEDQLNKLQGLDSALRHLSEKAGGFARSSEALSAAARCGWPVSFSAAGRGREMADCRRSFAGEYRSEQNERRLALGVDDARCVSSERSGHVQRDCRGICRLSQAENAGRDESREL